MKAMEPPAQRFELIARMAAHGTPEIEGSDTVRLARSVADPLRIRRLLLNSASGTYAGENANGATGSALSHILSAFDRRVSVKPKPPVPSGQPPKARIHMVSVVSIGTTLEEDVIWRFDPSLDDISKAVLADAGVPKVKQGNVRLFGAALTLVLLAVAIGLSLWLFR